MLDNEGYEYYLRQKWSLERRLEEVSACNLGAEIKSQMSFVEARLLARIKQAHHHATQEMGALRMLGLLEAPRNQRRDQDDC